MGKSKKKKDITANKAVSSKADSKINKPKIEDLDDIFSDVKNIKAAKKKAEEDLIADKKVKEIEEQRRLELEWEMMTEAKRASGIGSWNKRVKPGLISIHSKNVIKAPEAPLERIDAESGLPVYKAHLLEVGGGGGTELCPFDCECCF